MDTSERLTLMYVHDILVTYQITKPLSYLEICKKLDLDEDFVEYLRAYRKLLEK